MPSLISQSDSRIAKSVHGREYCKAIPVDEDEYLAWRIQNDFDFYARKLLKIVTKGQIIPFNLRREQKILNNIVRAMKICNLPVRIIVLKARRLGFSTEIEGMGTQETTTRPFRRAKVVAHLGDSSEEIFEMTKIMYDELNPAFRPIIRYSTRTQLLFENPKDDLRPDNPGLRSKFTVATAGSKAIGRGGENTFLHLSEAAHYDETSGLTTGLLQTVDEEPDTSVFVESTANGVGNWYHDQYWGHKEGKEQLIADLIRDYEDVDKLCCHFEEYPGPIGYLPLFFPWHEFVGNRIPISTESEREYMENSLDEEEQELIDRFGVDYEQLKWRRAKLSSLAETAEGISPLELFKQENPSSDEEAFLATGRGFFDAKALRETEPDPVLFKGRTSSEVPVYRRFKGYKPLFNEHPFGELSIFRRPKKDRQYSIGVDVAFAEKGRDYSCIQVIDKQSFEQVAEWHGKTLDPDELGRAAMMLGCFYNTAVVAIERNNMGIGSVIALRDTRYPYIYSPKTHAKVEGDGPLDSLGWENTSVTRPLALGHMEELLRSRRLKINSPGLISECLSFKFSEKGKPEAESGKRDDRVLAMAIACQAALDMPYIDKKPTLARMLHEEDFKETLMPQELSYDSELGDVVP